MPRARAQCYTGARCAFLNLAAPLAKYIRLQQALGESAGLIKTKIFPGRVSKAASCVVQLSFTEARE